MPTLHTASRNWMEQRGICFAWRISKNAAKRSGPSGGRNPPGGSAIAIVSPDEKTSAGSGRERQSTSNLSGRRTPPGLSDLKRKSDEVVWVREGKTEHPAYELETNGTDLGDAGGDDTIWVEWASNGKRGCVSRLQMAHGLGARRRQRPNYLSYKDQAPAAPAAKPEHAGLKRTKTARAVAASAEDSVASGKKSKECPASGGKKNKDRGKYKTFSDRLEELRAYRETHGHMNVKRDENASLYQFAANVKYAKKHPGKGQFKLDEGRIAALEALGFWSGNQYVKKSFEERLADLRAYRERNGHINVKQNEDASLYQFVAKVKYSWKNPGKRGAIKLDERRIAALDELGIDLSASHYATSDDEELRGDARR